MQDVIDIVFHSIAPIVILIIFFAALHEEGTK